MIVAEIKTKQLTDREDWHILSDQHSHDTQITYILSLGVNKEFRRHGIGNSLPFSYFKYPHIKLC